MPVAFRWRGDCLPADVLGLFSGLRKMMVRSWLFWAVNLILQGGFWLLLTWKLELWEGIAAAVSAILAATAGAAYDKTIFANYRPRISDLALFWRVPWQIIADSARVLLAIGLRIVSRLPSGTLHRAPFECEGPKRAARRAVATTYATMSPNSIVVAIIPEQRLVLYHQLVERPLPSILRDLGGRP